MTTPAWAPGHDRRHQSHRAGAETARELAYVAASRGRQLNELYLDTGGTVDVEGERPATPHVDPAAVMAQMLAGP